jgi:aspartyl-tRNA(Asn)/glutamyl-tRNA(Gln) amidotransferase subunit C
MKITDHDVTYVADLANLDLTDQERQRMVRDLNSILDYIDRLNELDTTKVPPMAQTLPGNTGPDATRPAGAPRQGALRDDELLPCLSHQDAVKNAPDTDGNFFKVPKVIEK